MPAWGYSARARAARARPATARQTPRAEANVSGTVRLRVDPVVLSRTRSAFPALGPRDGRAPGRDHSMQGFRCAAVRSVLVVQTLLALPSTLQAQESTLVQNPVESSPSLKEQFRLLRWSPALPPPQWKCWAMGNGARDWRHGDLADCHIFMGHEVNFNSEDIRTLTEGIVANGSDLVHIDFGGSGIGESAGSSEMGHDSSLVPVGRSNGAEALGELLSSSLNLEQVNLERNGFGPTDAMILGNSIASTECPSRLRLGWNAIGPAGGKALAEGLASAESGLRELSLEENALTDAGDYTFATLIMCSPLRLNAWSTSSALQISRPLFCFRCTELRVGFGSESIVATTHAKSRRQSNWCVGREISWPNVCLKQISVAAFTTQQRTWVGRNARHGSDRVRPGAT